MLKSQDTSFKTTHNEIVFSMLAINIIINDNIYSGEKGDTLFYFQTISKLRKIKM